MLIRRQTWSGDDWVKGIVVRVSHSDFVTLDGEEIIEGYIVDVRGEEISSKRYDIKNASRSRSRSKSKERVHYSRKKQNN